MENSTDMERELWIFQTSEKVEASVFFDFFMPSALLHTAEIDTVLVKCVPSSTMQYSLSSAFKTITISAFYVPLSQSQ